MTSLPIFQVVGDDLGWGFVVRGHSPCYVQAVDPGSPSAAAGVRVSGILHTFYYSTFWCPQWKNIVLLPNIIVFRCGSLCVRWMDGVFCTWIIGPLPHWWWLDLAPLSWKSWTHWNENCTVFYLLFTDFCYTALVLMSTQNSHFSFIMSLLYFVIRDMSPQKGFQVFMLDTTASARCHQAPTTRGQVRTELCNSRERNTNLNIVVLIINFLIEAIHQMCW